MYSAFCENAAPDPLYHVVPDDQRASGVQVLKCVEGLGGGFVKLSYQVEGGLGYSTGLC